MQKAQLIQRMMYVACCRFVYSPFVQNRCGRERFDPPSVVAASPDTFLVHSRWPLLPPPAERVARARVRARRAASHWMPHGMR